MDEWRRFVEKLPGIGHEIWVYEPESKEVMDFRYFGMEPLIFGEIELWQPKVNDIKPDPPKDE